MTEAWTHRKVKLHTEGTEGEGRYGEGRKDEIDRGKDAWECWSNWRERERER